jgi:hypothetical protein
VSERVKDHVEKDRSAVPAADERGDVQKRHSTGEHEA